MENFFKVVVKIFLTINGMTLGVGHVFTITGGWRDSKHASILEYSFKTKIKYRHKIRIVNHFYLKTIFLGTISSFDS